MALAINYSISKSKYHQRQRSDTVSYVDEFVTSKNQVINTKERQSVHSVKTKTLLMSFKYLKDLFKAAQSKVFSFQPNKTNLPINLLIHYTTTYVHQKKIINSYHHKLSQIIPIITALQVIEPSYITDNKTFLRAILIQ